MAIQSDAEVAASVIVGGTDRSGLFYNVATHTWYTKDQAGTTAPLISGVSTFNGRSGAVSPIQADYDAFFLTPAEGNAAYQPLDSDLTAIAALAPANDDFVQRKAGAWTNRTPTQVTADLIDATYALPGRETAAEKIAANSQDGRTSAGATPRVFRIGDYMVGNTYDPTGTANSTTAITAMVAAIVAHNDRYIIELTPGVFKCNPGVFTGLPSASGGIRGPGEGLCVLLPTATGDFITLPSALTGSDAFKATGFTIYNTSGTPFTTGAGINVNGCDNVTIDEVGFVDLFYDINVNGAAIKTRIQNSVHYQTNGNASSSGILISNGAAGDTYIGPYVVMSNGGATRRKASIEIIESGHYELVGCNLTGSVQGLLIAPTAGKIVAFGFHTNLLCDSNTTNGMTLSAATATSTIKNIKSMNSWYSGTVTGGGSGVVSSGTAGGIINGVTHMGDRMLNNQQHGYQHGFGTDFRFSDCDMKGNNASNAAIGTGYDGLNVAAAVSNWSVNGGKFGGTDTLVTSTQQRYGINVLAGAGDNINCVPDDLSGNRDGPLQMGATGANVFIQGCPGLMPSKAMGANAAVANTNTVVVSVPMPKNSVRVGTTVRVSGGGIMTNGAASSPFFRFYANPATLGASIPALWSGALGATVRTNIPFQFDGMVTVKSIGAGGTIFGFMSVQIYNAVVPVVVAGVLAATALNTTVDNLLEFAFISGAATTTFTFTSVIMQVVNY